MLTPLSAPTLSSLEGIRHGFFTREGGVSTGIYASLNCGLGSSDDRAAVTENRARVARHLGGREPVVVTLHQHHSADAVRVDTALSPKGLPKADAVVTRTRGLVVGALAADCTPVLLADATAGVVGAAHAGWRGAVSGVLEAAIGEMVRAGADPSRIVAAVGPSISQSAYEVGPEFEAELVASNPGNGRFFARTHPGARAHFDLPGYVTARLERLGVGVVDRVSPCTRDDDRFFSYRRSRRLGQADYGRQISAIVVT